MTIKICAAAALAACFATPAFAGAYVQANVGYDNVSVAGDSDDGVLYGVGLGYEAPIGKAVFAGIEANIEDSSTKACVADVFEAGDRACLSARRDLSVVARLGTNVSDAAALYVLAGYTNARLKASYTDSTGTIADADNGDGVRVGAGLKYGFGGNLFSKLEYRYSNYEADFSRHQVVAAFGIGF